MGGATIYQFPLDHMRKPAQATQEAGQQIAICDFVKTKYGNGQCIETFGSGHVRVFFLNVRQAIYIETSLCEKISAHDVCECLVGIRGTVLDALDPHRDMSGIIHIERRREGQTFVSLELDKGGFSPYYPLEVVRLSPRGSMTDSNP